MQKTDARHSANAGESKLHFLDYWRVIRVRFGIVLLAFILVVITAAAVTYMMQRKYRSDALLEVRTAQEDITIYDKARPNFSVDPMFLPTQTEIMRSHEVLDPVVTGQELTRVWAVEGQPLPPEAAFGKLVSMLDLKQVRGTQLLQLQVTSTNREEAQRIATAVAESYRDSRTSRIIDPAVKVQNETEAQLKEQRTKLSDLDSRMNAFRKSHPELRFDNILEADGKVTDPYQSEIAARQQEVDKLRSGIDGLSSRLDKVTNLKGDELMRSLTAMDIPDPTVSTILPKYQANLSEEAAMLNSGLGPNHPAVVAQRETRKVYTQQLNEQVGSIKHSLANNLDVQKRTLESLEKSLTELRATAISNRSASDEYRVMADQYNRVKQTVDDTDKVLSTQRIAIKAPVNPVKILNPATLPSVPSSPRVYLNMAIGVAMGLIVGVGLAFFIEYLDTSVKTMDDVETILGVPVLAIVPKNIKLLHKQPTDVPDAEAYRILRTNIEFNRKSADANTISMVSGGPGEGKSTTLCNLAFTCAQGGYSVLIVDADLRRPTQHKLFEVNNSVGLTNYLTTNIQLEEVILSTPVENLSLMPSGILPSDAVGILNSQRMSDMIAELKTRYDIIFFDSPPILGVSDGAVLASEVDQSIIIVQHRRFPRAMLLRVKQAIQNVGGTVLGVVLNNVDLRHDPNYAYYTSYYEYYAIRTPAENAVAAAGSGKQRPVVAAGGSGKGGSSEY